MSEEGCLGTDTLVAFVEGRSEDGVRDRVEQHAAACERCRRVLSSLARSGESPAPAPIAAAPIAEPPARVGRYQIARKLGEGGMGVVYAAHDPELDRAVAVKLLRGPERAGVSERLRREAQAMAQLAHPNVVAVFDVGVYRDQLFVAMELVAGETLTQWLAHADAPRTPRAILDAYGDAGRGLAAAHAAGIAHRDFKPDNVLVGADGRVRVADFGLARTAGGGGSIDTAAEVSPIAPTAPAGALTRTGAVVGTPFYMAPELYDGSAGDARSDQFAFCVALFAALHGERPFAGDTFGELGANVRAGNLRDIARPRLPARVRRAIRRGLAVDPAARFASMDALLAELAPRDGRHARAITAAAIAAVALGGGALAFAARDRAPAPCAADELRLAGVWDPPQRLAVAAALFATGAPYAEQARAELDRTLDRYAADWDAMQLDACRATRVRGEQTADVLDLRTTCLDERRRALAGLVDALSASAPASDAASRAISAAQQLPAIADCADLGALLAQVRPPNPAVKSRVIDLTGRLAELQAKRDVGAYAASLPVARAVLAEAVALGYRPLEARAQLIAGKLGEDVEDYAAARAAYTQAALAAEAGRSDRLAVEALTDLLDVTGTELGRYAEVPALRDRANAALERIDRPPALVAELDTVLGAIDTLTGQLATARVDFDTAVQTYERIHGPGDLSVVNPLRGRANLLLQLGTPDATAAARADLERMLAIQRRVLGDAHPDVAETLHGLAGVYYVTGDNAAADPIFRDAEARTERMLGSDSPTLAAILSDHASSLEAMGKTAEAVAIDRRTVAIAERRLGPAHPTTLRFRERLAAALGDDGHLAEAADQLTALLVEIRAALGPGELAAEALQELASAELTLHRAAAARDHAREACAMNQQLKGADYRPFDEPLVIGGAELELGHPAAARAALEQALANSGDEPDPQVERCKALLAKARAAN